MNVQSMVSMISVSEMLNVDQKLQIVVENFAVEGPPVGISTSSKQHY